VILCPLVVSAFGAATLHGLYINHTHRYVSVETGLVSQLSRIHVGAVSIPVGLLEAFCEYTRRRTFGPASPWQLLSCCLGNVPNSLNNAEGLMRLVTSDLLIIPLSLTISPSH
jgi:hypothetical protein